MPAARALKTPQSAAVRPSSRRCLVNRETLRRPSPGTAVAIAALVLAATPIADAATSGKKAPKVRVAAPVAHARYADNAGHLGGYRASFVPTPNTIVPL